MPVDNSDFETDLEIGPRAIGAYARLNYSMWYALAEFIDNSTQSRLNYEGIIDSVLAEEGTPLIVEITHHRVNREIRIKDNSIGMSRDVLVNALRVAAPTIDSKGRSKYGLGLKTAACWIGKKWKVVTTEWSSGLEWTAEVDVNSVSNGGKIPITSKLVNTNEHGTEIIISDLNRTIQGRTEENIREYLGSMYRFDLMSNKMKLIYNGNPIPAPDERVYDTDEHGHQYKRDLIEKTINGHLVRGWIAVLSHGSGGRKYGGFSLFQNGRQIEGFPRAWKPKSIFGGVDDEGANNVLAQRLTGVIELDGFDVSHTKDAILFQDSEQEDLEAFLLEQSKDFIDYAKRRRKDTNTPWKRDKVKELIEGMKSEFTTDEIKDAAVEMLPPIETILANNEKQVEALNEADIVTTLQILPELSIIVSLKEESEYEPYLTISASAKPGEIHVIINNLHPYYESIESPDAKEECLKQFIYDAISEYLVSKQQGKINPNSTRRKKNDLLRAKSIHTENVLTTIQQSDFQTTISSQ